MYYVVGNKVLKKYKTHVGKYILAFDMYVAKYKTSLAFRLRYETILFIEMFRILKYLFTFRKL